MDVTHVGSSFDSYLAEQGLRALVEKAAKRRIARMAAKRHPQGTLHLCIVCGERWTAERPFVRHQDVLRCLPCTDAVQACDA